MANTATIPTSTKQAWQNRATPTTDTYKLALYTSAGNYRAALVGGDSLTEADVRLVSVA